MEFEFDIEKDKTNVAKHGISLSRAVELEILRYVPAARGGERRVRAFGLIEGKYYCLVFTFRPNAVRAIGLRRAHREEVEDHE